MRYTLALILFCLYSGLSYSQQYHTDTTTIGHLDDPPLTLKVFYSYSTDRDIDSTHFLVSFTRNGHAETRIFAQSRGFESEYGLRQLETRQLDGKGMPEIIATIHAADHSRSGWWEQYEVHIWNLDTYMDMFTDIVAYETQLINMDSHPVDSIMALHPVDSVSAAIYDKYGLTEGDTRCAWRYELGFTDKGILTIPPFKIEALPANDSINPTCAPKYVAGTYVIKNGLYVLKEE